MKKAVTLIVLTTLLFSLTGCATITMNAQGLSQPVVMNSELGPDVGYRAVDQVRKQDRAFWLVGLINIKDPDIRGMLLDANPAADAYTDVEIRTMFRPLDIVISYLTFGVIISRSVVVRATVVEFND